jgi:hypothetical protein
MFILLYLSISELYLNIILYFELGQYSKLNLISIQLIVILFFFELYFYLLY